MHIMLNLKRKVCNPIAEYKNIKLVINDEFIVEQKTVQPVINDAHCETLNIELVINDQHMSSK